MGKRQHERNLKKVKKDLPFQSDPQPSTKIPRNMKTKQKSWILAGLRHLKAPIVLATLVTLLFQVDGLDWTQPADHVETFAGAMAVTRAEWMEGRHAIPLDLTLDPNNMDFLTDKGFCNCLYHVCNSKPGSGYLTAPVCSTFVFMSRGSTLRSSRKPLGRDDSEAVRQGNVLCGRAVILCILAAAKMMWWVLEQPQSSVMHLHPMFQYMIRLLGVHRLRVTMSSFGGPTKKGTHLYSGHECIEDIQEHTVPEQLEDRDMAVPYYNARGEKRVHGGKDLKSSQHYPDQFGVALAKARTSNRKKNFRTALKFLREARATKNDYDRRRRLNQRWIRQADLQPIIDFLSQSHN